MPGPGVASYNFVFAITPADVDLPVVPDAIYVGGTGTVVAVNGDLTTATFTAVPVAAVLNIRPRRIAAASTATLIVGMKMI